MAVLSELRYPTTRFAKIFSVLLALFLFGFVSVATIAGILLYQILRPARNPSSLDLSVMMGHPTTFSFPLADGTSREGWFFPGLRGAPTIVVSHGYLAQRTEVLTLVTSLQEHQFNVFTFDFAGHGSSPGLTTLGYRETSELRSAIQALSTRDDVDPKHFGLWGVSMGGYASLEVATSDPRIGALVVDSAYSDPRALVQIEVRRSGLGVLPFVGRFCDFGFRLLNYQFRSEPPVTNRLIRLKGIPKIFIQADDKPELTNETLQLFIHSPDPRQLVREHASYSEMSDEDRHTYENQIVSFFLVNIPPTAQLSH
ncbi:MAG: alpha/beta fold hydrolase [Candidatus Acidiferrales bacterium]